MSQWDVHRKAIGQPPLDPVAADWTHEDLLAEMNRLRRLEGLMPNPHVRALRERLSGPISRS